MPETPRGPGLHKVKAVTGTPIPEVIEVLEAMLSDARAGDVRSIVAVYESEHGTVRHAWAIPDGSQHLALVGGIEVAKHSMLDVICNSEDDE